MLQMVSKNIVKDRFLVSHCVLDEIGTISTDYFKELKEFVNRSGFVFLNGMPIEDDDFKLYKKQLVYINIQSSDTNIQNLIKTIKHYKKGLEQEGLYLLD